MGADVQFGGPGQATTSLRPTGIPLTHTNHTYTHMRPGWCAPVCASRVARTDPLAYGGAVRHERTRNEAGHDRTGIGSRGADHSPDVRARICWLGRSDPL